MEITRYGKRIIGREKDGFYVELTAICTNRLENEKCKIRSEVQYCSGQCVSCENYTSPEDTNLQLELDFIW